MVSIEHQPPVRQRTGAHPSEMAPDGETTRATWFSFLLGAILYPAWGALSRYLLPTAVDPMLERLALSGLLLVFMVIVVLSRVPRLAMVLNGVATYLFTAHIFLLAARNDLAVPYDLALFILIGAATLSFVTLRAVVAYSLFTSLLSAMISVRLNSGRGALLVVGVMTAQGIMAALAWRNIALHRASRLAIQGSHDFLSAILDEMLDPIFVLDEHFRCLLTNNAMDRAEQAAVLGFDDTLVEDRATGLLAMLRNDLTRALDARQPIERELRLLAPGEGRVRTVLVKISSHRLATGARCLIGLIRDITERKALEESLEAKMAELQAARSKVKLLEGLLPICMHCGRIRNQGDWEELETYIEAHSGAVFSHGLCDTCMDEHYPESGG